MDRNWFDTKPTITYFRKLIDSQGIIQFSLKEQKDYHHGYAIEDQARGLLAALRLEDQQLIDLFVSLIKRSQDPNGVKMLWDENGKYLDKVDYFGEASAECLWALGHYLKKYSDPQAAEMVKYLTKGILNSPFPRVWTYALLGLVELEDHHHTRILANKLMAAFQQHADNQWRWFEDQMTYANALFPWAMLASYQLTDHTPYLEVGIESLEFLLNHLSVDDLPIVVGNQGWWSKGEQPALYDQQPIDVAYLSLCCFYAHQISYDQGYYDKALFYYSWFFGNNLQKVKMIRPDGGCSDGLNRQGPNPNSGAESTICFLLAALEAKSKVHQLASNSYKSLAF